MKLFAISDLHLAFQVDKPMDIFESSWKKHYKKIKWYWERTVMEQDTVIIGGDISWGMNLREAEEDLNFIGELPGTKVMIRGNHDYWWESISKVRKNLPDSVYAIQNDFFPLDFDNKLAICGTRGWHLLEHDNNPEHDKKMVSRELHRLELSLQSAWNKGFHNPIVTLHYPPLYKSSPSKKFSQLMKKYLVKICIYGHLHGKDHIHAFTGTEDGITYYFTSRDYLNFRPLEIQFQ